MTDTPNILDYFRESDGFGQFPKAATPDAAADPPPAKTRMQKLRDRVGSGLKKIVAKGADALRITLPVFRKKAEDGTMIDISRLDDAKNPALQSYEMLASKSGKIEKQSLSRSRNKKGIVEIQVEFYKHLEEDTPHLTEIYDGKFNLLRKAWSELGGAKEDRQVKYRKNGKKNVETFDLTFYPRTRPDADPVRKQQITRDRRGYTKKILDYFPVNEEIQKFTTFYPRSKVKKEVEEYIAPSYTGDEKMKKYAANLGNFRNNRINRVSTFREDGSPESQRDKTFNGISRSYIQFDEEGRPAHKQTFYPDGGLKSDILYEDGVISSRKVYHKKPNTKSGPGEFINSNRQKVSEPRELVYDGYYVDLEFRVGKFMDDMARACTDDTRKKDVFDAFKVALDTNFNGRSYIQFFDKDVGKKAVIKQELVEHIRSKYTHSSDKLDAFLLAVGHPDLRLPGDRTLPTDNPLKTYKPRPVRIGQKNSETIATANTTINNTFDPLTGNLLIKKVEHATTSGAPPREEELRFYSMSTEPGANPDIKNPRLQDKRQKIAAEELREDGELAVVRFRNKDGTPKSSEAELNTDSKWRNYADEQEAKLAFSKRVYPGLPKTAFTEVEVKMGEHGTVSVTLQGSEAAIKNARDRVEMKKVLDKRIYDSGTAKSKRMPLILRKAEIRIEPAAATQAHDAGTDGNISELHITIPYTENQKFVNIFDPVGAQAAARLLSIIHQYTDCDLGLSVTPAPQNHWGTYTTYADVTLRHDSNNQLMKSVLRHVAEERVRKLPRENFHIVKEKIPDNILLRVMGEQIHDKGQSRNRAEEARRKSGLMAESITHALGIPDPLAAQPAQQRR